MVKSEKSKNKSVKSGYPMVMEWVSDLSKPDRGLLVLMSEHEVGTVIYAEGRSDHTVGVYADDWDMKSFVPYTGEVTLSNE
jgi:hypothetical protein